MNKYMHKKRVGVSQFLKLEQNKAQRTYKKIQIKNNINSKAKEVFFFFAL